MNLPLPVRRAARFVRTLVREYEATGCDDSAAKLTYATLFAVVPTLTVAWAILRSLPQLGGLAADLDRLIFTNLVPATGEQVRAYIAGFSEQASNLTGIGVAFLAVTALMMLMAIERRINAVWRLHRERSLLSSLLVYWALLTLGPVLLVAGIATSSFLLSAEFLGNGAARVSPLVAQFLGVVPFFVEVALFSLLYIVVPNCSVPVRHGITGGLVAAILFEVAKAGFAFFVLRFNSYELVYGAFAAVPLFLLWVYISWSITLFGVVLVYVLGNLDEDSVGRGSPFPALLKVLALFHRRQQEGMAVSDAGARHVANAAGIANWHDLRESLLGHRVLERLPNGDLLLVRDLHRMTLGEVARLFHWDEIAVVGTDMPEPDDFARENAARLAGALAAFDACLADSVASVFESTPGDIPA